MDIKYKLDSIFLLRSSRLVPLTVLQYSVNIHSVWDLWYSCFWHCQIGFTSPYCFLSSSNCSGPLVISLSFSSEKFFSFGSNWGWILLQNFALVKKGSGPLNSPPMGMVTCEKGWQGVGIACILKLNFKCWIFDFRREVMIVIQKSCIIWDQNN